MKTNWKKVGIGVLCAVSLLLLIAVGLFFNELRSLMSLEKLDDYGMFRMTYYGDYGFDKFLETGAKSDADIEAFVAKRLLKGLPIDLGVTGNGCTAFVAKNDEGELIFGRNFDFEYAPSLQLYTKPEGGYASVSTVNLAFAGYSQDFLPHGVSFDSFLTLVAPFLPFDGMNEKGVTMALLAVPEAEPEYVEGRVMLNTTTAIRLVLDKAATVDEALELLGQYNLYFSGNVDCHFLIADASGRSVIAEFYDGAMQIVETEEDYQIASNFIAYNGLNIGEGFTEFERYDAAKAAIEEGGGRINEDAAAELLADIGVIGRDGTDKLQWTVIYNITSGNGSIFANRKAENAFDFHLDMAA